MYPSLEEVKKLAASGKYRRIPVMRTLYEDRYTTVEVLRRLRTASSQCFLLESAERDQSWGRYSFLGYDPVLTMECRNGRLRIRRGKETGAEDIFTVSHPKEIIRRILADYRSPVISGFPSFTGGLVGYFSYDFIKYSEPSLRLETRENGDFPDLDLMLFDRVIVFDHYRQSVLLIAGVEADAAEASYQKAGDALDGMQELLTSGPAAGFPPLQLRSELVPACTEKEYSEMVEKAKRHILEGDIFQVVLSNPLTARAAGSILDVYRVLRVTNPSPYMFYLTGDDLEIAGASPETLAKLENGVVHTFPLAGTRPRGKTEEEDRRLEEELRNDEKELAEHNMLVDLGRNDLGRVSRIGSVTVETYQDILRFSHVMHIGSTVRGILREDQDALDVIDAVLPAGTLSGAPKIRACEIIEAEEHRKRGIYGGAVGYLDFSGNMDTCIGIRLAYKKGDQLCIQSGAGIVADSVPANEYRECLNKAQAVASAVKEAEGGLE